MQNPTPEEDDMKMTASAEISPAEPAPELSRFEQVRAVQTILTDVAQIPDTVDGLDMRQFKRLASSSGAAFMTNLTAVLKLAAT